jgi:hypothetical protein
MTDRVEYYACCSSIWGSYTSAPIYADKGQNACIAVGATVFRVGPDSGAGMSDIRLNLDGIYAVLFGLPALAFACGIVGLLLVFPAYRLLKIIAIVLAIPALLLGLAFVTDALALGGPAGDDTLDLMVMVAYFALLGLLPCLLFIQVRREPRQNPSK